MANTGQKRSSARTADTETKDQPLMRWNRNHTIIAAAGAAVAAAGAAFFAFGRRVRDGVALDEHESGAARSAGPEAMRDPPEEWETVDQASDESFPASDPPPVNPHVD
jgi:hypothetical protein